MKIKELKLFDTFNTSYSGESILISVDKEQSVLTKEGYDYMYTCLCFLSDRKYIRYYEHVSVIKSNTIKRNFIPAVFTIPNDKNIRIGNDDRL